MSAADSLRDMSNPVIIIVGAGPGIGAATARRFAAAGYDIGLIARNTTRVEKLASELTKSGTTVGYAIVDAGEPEALTHALSAMGNTTNVWTSSCTMRLRTLPVRSVS